MGYGGSPLRESAENALRGTGAEADDVFCFANAYLYVFFGINYWYNNVVGGASRTGLACVSASRCEGGALDKSRADSRC